MTEEEGSVDLDSFCEFGSCIEDVVAPGATMCREHTSLFGRCLSCGEDRGARAAARAVAGGPNWLGAWCETCRQCSDCSGRPHCMLRTVPWSAYPTEAHGLCEGCGDREICGACLGCRMCCMCRFRFRHVDFIAPSCHKCNLRPGVSSVMTPETSGHLFRSVWLCVECKTGR